MYTVILVVLNISTAELYLTGERYWELLNWSNPHSISTRNMWYSVQELYALTERVCHSDGLQKLGRCTSALVRQLRLNKRRKGGRKGERKIIEQSKRLGNPKNLIEKNISDYNSNDIDFQFLLANVQSIKSKEYVLRDELNKNNATFAGITEICFRGINMYHYNLYYIMCVYMSFVLYVMILYVIVFICDGMLSVSLITIVWVELVIKIC